MQPFDQQLDTSGLLCPQPLLQAKLALNQLQAGQVLKVISTDPSSIIDFRVFSETTAHKLLAMQEWQGMYFFWLEKAMQS